MVHFMHPTDPKHGGAAVGASSSIPYLHHSPTATSAGAGGEHIAKPEQLTSPDRQGGVLNQAGLSLTRGAGSEPITKREQFLSQLFVLILAAGLMAMIGRVYYIQQVYGGVLAEKAARQQRVVLPLPARRGYITDSAGRVLAGSVQEHSVFADPDVIGDENYSAVAERLAPILHLNQQELQAKLKEKSDKRFVWLKRKITREETEEIKKLKLEGVGLVGEPVRNYPMGDLASHVIGYCGSDQIGLDGLERSFNARLAGEDGYKEMISDVRRRPIDSPAEAYIPPRDGYSLMLTIDSVIQQSAQTHLKEAVEKYQAKAGLAIVMDPRTGEVLALANWPTFDPNHYNQVTVDNRRNRTITDPFEPGSIFKSVVASAALDRKVVKLDDTFYCENGLWVIGKRLLHDHKPYGTLSVREIVVHSSNIGMAKIGVKMGNPTMFSALKAFGLTQRTGIDLPGEDPGLVPPFKKWNSYTTTSIPMGHEAACTALQLLNAFCAILNEGKLMQPRIVRGLMDSSGNVIEDRSAPIFVRQAMSAETAKLFTTDVMANVVNCGTGRKVRMEHYQVVGKTGTAQIPRFGHHGYEDGAYVSSFMGGAPASGPRLAVMVSVFRPKKSIGYYGGTVAAPAVRDILADAIAYLGLPPERECEPDTVQDLKVAD